MDCVFLSTQAWDEMSGQSRRVHSWVCGLLERGARVLFIEAQPSPRRQTAYPNLTVVPLAELGFDARALRRAWYSLDPKNSAEFSRAFLCVLSAFESREAKSRFAFWCDPLIPYVLLLPELRQRGYCAIYDSRDDYVAMTELGYYFEDLRAEEFLVRQCDLTVAVSTPVLARLATQNPNANLRLLRQGFDPSAFRLSRVFTVPPIDLARGEKTLGFWGLVNDFCIDTTLLNYVARAHPTWTINLLGPVDSDPSRPSVANVLRDSPNIHLLGHKPHAQLVEYAAGCDAMLIPYPAHAFSRGRDPLKVYEYLACYKLVVAAHTPQIEEMPYVYHAVAPADFLRAIETALNVAVDRVRVDDYLANCTWAARVDTLLKWLAELSPHTESVPVVTLEQFYSERFTPNLELYIAHTEQLLDERTAYIEQMQREWQATQTYLKKLERTHPLIWLKRWLKH